MRFTELQEIFKNLTTIKTNVVNLNYQNRKPHILESKLKEATIYFSQLNREIAILNEKIGNSELDDKDIDGGKSLISNIKSLYTDISDLCSQTYEIEKDTHVIIPYNLGQSENTNMAAFDLKTAVSLLPLMDDTEDITNELIDAIKMYETILNEHGKILLIKII